MTTKGRQLELYSSTFLVLTVPIIIKVSRNANDDDIYSAISILKGPNGQLAHLTISKSLCKHKSNRRSIYSREDLLTMRITREIEGRERVFGGEKG